MVIKIKYYTHGITQDNEARIATGWLPGKISENGWKRLRELKEITSKEKFNLVICSDLKRAVDTAKYLFEDRFRIIPDKRLRECDYGLYTGKSSEEFKHDMSENIYTPFPHGESYTDVEKRMKSLLDDLKGEFPEARIAFVGHQGPQLALDVLLMNKSWKQAIREDWRKTKSWRPGWDYTLI